MFGHRYFSGRYFGRHYFGPGFRPDTGAVTATEAADTLTSSATVGQEGVLSPSFFRMWQAEQQRRRKPIAARLAAREASDTLTAGGSLGLDPAVIDDGLFMMAA